VFKQAKAKPGLAPTRVASEYLLPPLHSELREFHRVSLVEDADSGSYHLGLDPNHCSLDQFGEPVGCTRMAIFGFEVVLETISEDDEQILYRLASKQQLPADLRLVVIRERKLRECPVRLLVMDEDDITQIIHLHPIAS